MTARAVLRMITTLVVLQVGAHAAAAAQDVNAFMSTVANAWGRDAEAIAALADRNGIAIEVEGTHVGAIPPRQAAAVLRRVFSDRETMKAVAGKARMIPGNSARAYAEIIWERRSRGTTQPERVHVFVAAAREGATWRITEIRLMP